MLGYALMACLVQTPAPPRAKPAPPVAEVPISGKIIALPYLPESVDSAHQAFGSIQPGLSDGSKELEQTLAGLYASPEARMVLPAAFKVAKSKAEELRFLASVVDGGSYRELEDACLKAWDSWQAAMVRNGPAESAKARPAAFPATSAEAKEDKDTGRRIKGLQISEQALKEERALVTDAMTVRGVRGARPEIDARNVAWVMATRAAHREAMLTTQVGIAMANHHAPSLAKAWTPFADRLNADALHLASSEVGTQPSDPPEIRALRTQARIQFLERFRSALWFSGVVWARMAGAPWPGPLRVLDPQAAPLPAAKPGAATPGP